MGNVIRRFFYWDFVLYLLSISYYKVYYDSCFLAGKSGTTDILLFDKMIFLILAGGMVLWLTQASRKIQISQDLATAELVMIGVPVLIPVLFTYIMRLKIESIWLNTNSSPIILFEIIIGYELFLFAYRLIKINRPYIINFERITQKCKKSYQRSKDQTYIKNYNRYKNYSIPRLKRERSYLNYEIYFESAVSIIAAVLGIMFPEGSLRNWLLICFLIWFYIILKLTGTNKIRIQVVEDILEIKENNGLSRRKRSNSNVRDKANCRQNNSIQRRSRLG